MAQSGLAAYIYSLPNLNNFLLSEGFFEGQSRMKQILKTHSWTRTNAEGLNSFPDDWTRPDRLNVPYNLARGDPFHEDGVCLVERAEGSSKSCAPATSTVLSASTIASR
jgi:hypothetical protein